MSRACNTCKYYSHTNRARDSSICPLFEEDRMWSHTRVAESGCSNVLCSFACVCVAKEVNPLRLCDPDLTRLADLAPSSRWQSGCPTRDWDGYMCAGILGSRSQDPFSAHNPCALACAYAGGMPISELQLRRDGTTIDCSGQLVNSADMPYLKQKVMIHVFQGRPACCSTASSCWFAVSMPSTSQQLCAG